MLFEFEESDALERESAPLMGVFWKLELKWETEWVRDGVSGREDHLDGALIRDAYAVTRGCLEDADPSRLRKLETEILEFGKNDARESRWVAGGSASARRATAPKTKSKLSLSLLSLSLSSDSWGMQAAELNDFVRRDPGQEPIEVPEALMPVGEARNVRQQAEASVQHITEEFRRHRLYYDTHGRV